MTSGRGDQEPSVNSRAKETTARNSGVIAVCRRGTDTGVVVGTCDIARAAPPGGGHRGLSDVQARSLETA